MKNIEEKDTLCWSCQRACGGMGCSWAHDFTPVDGWEAEQHGDSYFVKSCPLYIKERRFMTTLKEVASLMGIGERMVYTILKTKKRPIRYINTNYLKAKGYLLQRFKDEDDERHSYCLCKL